MHTRIYTHMLCFSSTQIYKYTILSDITPPSEAATSGSVQHSHKIKWAHKQVLGEVLLGIAMHQVSGAQKKKIYFAVLLSQSKF